MRVLIAGAAGFLGSHLTDALIAEGHSVLGVDNLCTGSLKNLGHLDHESKFEFLEQDICQEFDPKRVDYVFNFASPASPVDYLRLGIETLMWVRRVRATCWKSQRNTMRSFCTRQPRSAMGIPTSILRLRSTGGMSIRSVLARCTTRQSASRRRW